MKTIVGEVVDNNGVVHTFHSNGVVTRVNKNKKLEDSYKVRFNNVGQLEYAYKWNTNNDDEWMNLVEMCYDKHLAITLTQLYSSYLIEIALKL